MYESIRFLYSSRASRGPCNADLKLSILVPARPCSADLLTGFFIVKLTRLGFLARGTRNLITLLMVTHGNPVRTFQRNNDSLSAWDMLFVLCRSVFWTVRKLWFLCPSIVRNTFWERRERTLRVVFGLPICSGLPGSNRFFMIGPPRVLLGKGAQQRFVACRQGPYRADATRSRRAREARIG